MVYLVGVVPQVSLVEGAARVAHGHPQRRRRAAGRRVGAAVAPAQCRGAAASDAVALDGAEGAHDGLRGAAGWEGDALQGVRE
jgi:hypothetical protein